MATLNVKNLPDALYRKLQKRARERRRSIAREVTVILEDAVGRQEPLLLLFRDERPRPARHPGARDLEAHELPLTHLESTPGGTP